MTTDHRQWTVAGGKHRRPRSMVHCLAVVFSFSILFFLYACRPQPTTITLAFLGDINLGRGVDPTPASLAYLTPEMRAADLALANLESPLGKGDLYGRSGAAPLPQSDGYVLCAPADRARILADWKLDLLSLANNHRLDCSPDGEAATRAALDAAGLTPLGPGPDPVYKTVHGISMAFLAFDDVSSPLDVNAATQAINSAHASGALVIVAIHWGLEYQEGPSDRQESLAGQFTDAGAALVWGTHPHVLQPAEWIDPAPDSQSAKGPTLVLFSLGNALFDQPGLADTRQSALVMVAVDQDGVRSARAVPFVIDVAHSRVVAPDAATAKKIRDRLNIP